MRAITPSLKRRLAPVLLFAGVETTFARASSAQHFLSASPTIKVFHLKAKVSEPPYADSIALTPETAISLHGDSSVSIVIAFRNPFLFTYQTEVSEQETDQHKLAASFASTLSGFIKQFHSAGGSRTEAPTPVVIEGLNVRTTLANLEILQTYIADVPKEITKSVSENPSDLKSVRDNVALWKVDEVSKALADAIEPARAILIKCLVAKPDSAVLNGPGEKKSKCTDRAADDLGSIIEIARGIVSLEPNNTATLQTLKEFVDDAGHLGEEVPVGNVVESVSDKVLTVTATPVTKYQRFFEDVARKKQSTALKKFALVVRTYSPVSLSLGPALVIRFMETPKFGVAKQGDGYLIKRTDDGSATTYNLAAMLNIVPRAWSNPHFGGYIQIGADPTKDALGIYAGAGITVERAFTIGAGFAYQEVDQLVKGLAESQVIASPDLLKTKPQWRPGGYLTITIPIVK